jgi:hypothetical protein
MDGAAGLGCLESPLTPAILPFLAGLLNVAECYKIDPMNERMRATHRISRYFKAKISAFSR